MVTCQGSTRSELPWGLPALCRRTLGSERHRYAVAWPDKLGTDPMAYGGFINGRRRGTREESRKYAPDSAWVWRCTGWRGTGRLNPSRETKFSGTHGDRGKLIFPVQLTTSRIGNLTPLIHTLLYVMTIHNRICPPLLRWFCRAIWFHGKKKEKTFYFIYFIYFSLFSVPYFGLGCDHGNSFLCLDE